ncbi:MAG: T9SS type A sorting domain-containing protein [Candidatus Marinimicrobia bacterium]|nr:T9SS type A sorting domain-containing protein [Candidatus Neomarinimicrobiota bacterium]
MKVKNIRIVLSGALILALTLTFALANNQKQSLMKPAGDSGQNSFAVHKVGKVWNAVSNFGEFGDPNVPSGLPSMEWPGGSGVHHLWEGRFWVAANVDGEKRCSHADYGNYEWAGLADWPLTMGSGKSVEDSYSHYDDLNPDIHSTESLGLEIRQRGLTWSTKEFDDFIIYEMEVARVASGDGFSGDVLNDVYVAWVYDSDVGTGIDPTSAAIDDAVDFDGWDGNNPERNISYTVDIVHNLDWNLDGEFDATEGYDEMGLPLGWPHSGSPSLMNPSYDATAIQPDGFYDEYQVFLEENGPEITWQTTTTFTYNGAAVNTVAGDVAVLDGEVLHGYVIPRNMSYMYDADDPTTPEDDTQEAGVVPGFIGGRLIYTDYFKMYGPYGDTEDDIHSRVFSHGWWNWESDPGTDKDKFDYMAATHNASQGNHFMPHPFAIGAPTFDYRWLTSTGPFYNFKKGDVLNFVYAEVMGHGLAGMRSNADNALIAYYTGSTGNPYEPTAPDEDIHYLLPVPPPVPTLKYSPLNEGVRLAWDNTAELMDDPLILEPDFEGYRVYRSAYNPGDWNLLTIYDNTDNLTYVIDFDSGDTLRDGNGDYYFVNLPPFDVATTGIYHYYEDVGDTMFAMDASGNKITLWINEKPLNDLPYYYAVTSYDNPAAHGRPEFPPIESSRVNFATNSDGAPEPIFPEGMYEGSDTGPDELDVSVYPNPYMGASLLEEKYESKINFIKLPPDCRINVYSLAGDLIDVIVHNDGTTNESWDMVSRNTQEIATGLYVYVIETDDGRRQVGKFVVLRGE